MLLAVQTREKAIKMKRTKFEITACIMQKCLLPRSKTHIMYNGNLSFAQANTYLNMLISLGLLFRQNGKYATTDKGRQFIAAYNNLDKLIGTHARPPAEMTAFSDSAAPVGC